MIDKRLIIGAGITAIAVTVLSGLFSSEVVRSKESSNLNTGRGNTSAALMAQTPSMLDPSPIPALPMQPSFVNAAQQPGSNANQLLHFNANQQVDVAVGRPGGVVPNFMPDKVQISEAHWQGMDVGPLWAELRRKLKYPKGLHGVLVDEVTLNAARSGLMAGDVIISVGNVTVTSLEQFQQASRMVRDKSKAEMTALRKGVIDETGRFSMRRVGLVLSGDPELGFAQLESAPMIVPGDMRPHPPRGACTNCHNIGKGFELSPDPDLITLPPPVLALAVVEKGISPHRDRGPCEACHQIIQ